MKRSIAPTLDTTSALLLNIVFPFVHSALPFLVTHVYKASTLEIDNKAHTSRLNALQQSCYYSKLSICVKPLPSARESILTVLIRLILGRAMATYSHCLPIDINHIKTHALLCEKISPDDFIQAIIEFTNNLVNTSAVSLNADAECQLALEY
jgi:hypothetical protein